MQESQETLLWGPYLASFREAEARVTQTPWFQDGWEISTDYMRNGEALRGVTLRLTRSDWFEGAIHFESWLTGADLKRGTVPVVLHVETNQEKTGLNKGQFVKLLFERALPLMGSWDGYMIKEKYAAEPLRRNLSFDESNLATGLEAELIRLQQLEPIINQAITDLS